MSKLADLDGGYHPDDPDAPWNQERRTAPARKNTRKWCKGKVGREHQAVVVKDGYAGRWECGIGPSWWTKDRDQKWRCWHRERCSVCGKVLREWLPAERCPIWIEQQ